MVFLPRRTTPSARGRADGPLLVAARAAVLVPLGAGAVLVALAALFDGTADAMARVERGLLCAAVAVLVWSVVTAALRNVGDGELEVTAVFGSVVLMIAAYFTGPVALVAVPGVALVTGVVSAVRTDRAERRRRRERRERDARVRAHHAEKKRRKRESGGAGGG
ncbi:hypothetical protein [Streptomyces sp. CMB-StM0423]|uniref:hypothetical protein n=1 Tax=Streptomyces sp. CMB-StM0423 TaxID=2059884 RepID=UPI000C6FF0FE|nr:hypothetical protein [Streptomyces sp. CMB-StM0423]AUH43090.1 hypothetical protein CXR04_25560 [Streptomyces sp. CMB-StM0423]